MGGVPSPVVSPWPWLLSPVAAENLTSPDQQSDRVPNQIVRVTSDSSDGNGCVGVGVHARAIDAQEVGFTRVVDFEPYLVEVPLLG
jgi:hypothetical protein